MKPATIHLIDHKFQSQLSGKCSLLVRISRNRLSYAITDKGSDQIKVLFDSQTDGSREGLNALMDSDPILKFHFYKVKISVETSKFTFIPQEIYSDEEIDSYAAFIHPTLQSNILVRDIRSAKIKNIIAIDKSLNDDLRRRFTNPDIVNQANPLIESALKLYRSSDNILVLQFNSGSFEALLLRNNKLQYYNLFSIDSSDDFNYFLLGIIKELELKNTNTEVMLSGDIQENDENYIRIKKYFSTSIFADSNKLVLLTEIFKEVPAHQFFSLIGLNVCE